MQPLTNSNTTQGKNFTPSRVNVAETLSEQIIQVDDIQKLADNFKTFINQMAWVRYATRQERNADHKQIRQNIIIMQSITNSNRLQIAQMHLAMNTHRRSTANKNNYKASDSWQQLSDK